MRKSIATLFLLTTLLTACAEPIHGSVGEKVGISGNIPLTPLETRCGFLKDSTLEAQYSLYQLRSEETVYLKGLQPFTTSSEFANADVDESWMKVVPNEFGVQIYLRDTSGEWIIDQEVFSLMGVPSTAVVVNEGVTFEISVDENYNKTIEFIAPGCYVSSQA